MERSRTSIRQPLLVYASLFMVVLALVVGVISWFSLVNASRRAYRRAARRVLMNIAQQRSFNETEAFIAVATDATSTPVGEMVVSIATESQPAFGLSLADVRQEAVAPDLERSFVSIPLDMPGREVYLVALFDSSVPTSIALVEVARMTPFVLLGALSCAGVLVILVGRILLPPLDALRHAAEETRPPPSSETLTVSAPNEILEVAQRFRQTVRQLNEERERVEAQRDELSRMQQNLVRASKLASVGRLAAGIAHEVGNPLAAVQGYLSLLQGGLRADQATDVLDRSRKELGRIHDTIRKLLTYARTGEEHPAEPGAFALGPCLEEALGLARGHPALGRVELTMTAPDDVTAYGHPGHLHQVLVNLLVNAGQALAGRSDGRIHVRVVPDDTHLTIDVADNGDGIADPLIEAIFDPFYTTKDPGQGTGLGLAVSRALMEGMDGDLTVAESSATGATFRVVVPRAPQPR